MELTKDIGNRPDDGLPKVVSSRTAAHCAALMYGTLNDIIWNGSQNFIEGQGTLTFIRYKGKLFGITNQHVVHRAMTAYANEEEIYVFVAALDHHKRMPRRPIAQFTQDHPDVPFDLAIFSLPPDFLDGSNKTPIEVEALDSQTIDLALSESQANDLDLSESPGNEENPKLLAVGFPGSQRKMADPKTMSHSLFHVVGPCEAESDRKMILRHSFEEEKPAHQFGGMSGGPIFQLHPDGSYDFKGIIFQGKGFGDVNKGEPVSKEFEIWGFPLTASILERACEIAGLKL